MTKQDYYIKKVDCDYKDRCKSKGINCKDCKHNKAEEDHYEPIPIRWRTPSLLLV